MQIKEVETGFLIRLMPGEPVADSLKRFAGERELGFAAVQAIGAVSDIQLGYFDVQAGTYRYFTLEEQVEVLSLLGNLSRGPDGAPVLHAHVVVGRADGSTLGGHLVEASVRPTLEVVLAVQPVTVRRSPDPASGLVLWDLERGDA